MTMAKAVSETWPMKAFFSGMEWFPDCRDGGLDRYFFEQLQSMSVNGVKGEAIVSSAKPTTVGGIAIEGMAARGASLVERWRGARGLARRVLGGGVDVVNAHFALYAFPWINKIPARVPLVVNFQGPWAQEMRVESAGIKRRFMALLAKRIEGRVYRRADRLITLSEAFCSLLSQQYQIPLERIRVIPGALNVELYAGTPERLEARRRLGWQDDRTIFLAVRRLAKRMGLDLLIDAIARLKDEFPKLLLLIGGKGPESSALKTRIVDHRLEDHVQLLGFIPEADLPLAYAAADASVVPTLALEGFGLITAESLASGTPVLGTAVGATPEILGPLDPNLIFEAPTAEAIARRLRQVLCGEVRLPDRESCRDYARRYGWPAVTPKILEVYREAIEERRARA
jgi:glycosyltransferase involved in cell wall biosynthesis